MAYFIIDCKRFTSRRNSETSVRYCRHCVASGFYNTKLVLFRISFGDSGRSRPKPGSGRWFMQIFRRRCDDRTRSNCFTVTLWGWIRYRKICRYGTLRCSVEDEWHFELHCIPTSRLVYYNTLHILSFYYSLDHWVWEEMLKEARLLPS